MGNSQGIRGYTYEMVNLEFTCFVITPNIFLKIIVKLL